MPPPASSSGSSNASTPTDLGEFQDVGAWLMRIAIAAITAITVAAGGCAGAPRQHEVNLDLSSPAEAYPVARVPSTPIHVSVLDDRERDLVGKWDVVGIEVRARDWCRRWKRPSTRYSPARAIG